MNIPLNYLQRQSPFSQLMILVALIIATTFLTLFLGILLAIPFFGSDIFVLIAKAPEMNTPQDIALLKYLQVVSQAGIFILPAFVFAALMSNRLWSYLQMNSLPDGRQVLAVFFLLFAILPGINWLMEINAAMSLPSWLQGVESWMRTSEDEAARLTEAFLATTTPRGLIANLFVVALMAAVGEELLFRGILQKLFTRWFGNVHLGVLVTSILFSMFHLQFFGFLPRLLLGILFGYMLVWSGSLWLPILAHFINNASAVLVYYFYNRGAIATPAEDFGTIHNLPLLMLSLLASAALMYIIYYYRKKPFHEES
ncbi:MAG TPA: CPBP family intramembrane glutamic endopeptidase [Bacteroidales bacterium]|nr:CPBP family intramembrane glutamic endopeptidase [Bacteroidales bacterium]